MIHEYIERDSDHCVAVFNSRVAKRYEWYQTLEESRTSVLHLIDPDFSWYHGCIDQAQHWLTKYRPNRLVGCSMGAYAALLFGSLLNIPVKAFGPQTTLIPEWDDRWKTEWDRIKKETKYPQYLDLAGMKVTADIYYCEEVELDKRHAKRMKGCVLKPRGCRKHSDEVLNIRPEEIFESPIGVHRASKIPS